MCEMWRDVVGYEGIYSVGSFLGPIKNGAIDGPHEKGESDKKNEVV